MSATGTAGKQPPAGRGPTAAGILATAETTGIYELQQGYQQQQKQRGYTT
jgi:hypothetical protein